MEAWMAVSIILALIVGLLIIGAVTGTLDLEKVWIAKTPVGTSASGLVLLRKG